MAASNAQQQNIKSPVISDRKTEGRAGSRRIFPPQFKLQVLEAYRRDAQCRGNQRATARKFGIHRRQIQKWLQAEPILRATLLRRAPQPAPSPPPYSAGSPESARLPSPPPTVIATATITCPTVDVVPNVPIQPLHTPQLPSEPIDLSVKRHTPPPQQPLMPHAEHVPQEPVRKPFKLFRPYLLDDEDKRPHIPSPPVLGTQSSAFVPVQSSSSNGCAFTACLSPRWCTPVPAFPAPLR